MKDNKIPSPLVSLLPVFVLILLLFVTIRTFGSDALSGGSQVCLLVATAVCVLIGMAGFRRPWKDFELAVTNNIAGVSTALIILLIILHLFQLYPLIEFAKQLPEPIGYIFLD